MEGNQTTEIAPASERPRSGAGYGAWVRLAVPAGLIAVLAVLAAQVLWGPPGVLAGPSRADDAITPWLWLYLPVSRVARLGAQRELVTKQFSKRMPSAPIRSRLGVALIRLP